MRPASHAFIAIALLAAAPAYLCLFAAEFQEKLEKSYPFDTERSLHLSNVNGPVKIETWEKAEVQLLAVKKAAKEEDLARVKILITDEPKSLRIETKQTESKGWFRKNNSVNVSYNLKVPKTIRYQKISNVNGSLEIAGTAGETEASSVNGSLKVVDLSGRTSLSSVNGRIEASLAGLADKGKMSFEAVNGGIDLRLAEAARDFRIEASSLNGAIESDYGDPKKNFPIGQELNVVVGKSGPLLKLKTVNGAIKIRKKPQIVSQP